MHALQHRRLPGGATRPAGDPRQAFDRHTTLATNGIRLLAQGVSTTQLATNSYAPGRPYTDRSLDLASHRPTRCNVPLRSRRPEVLSYSSERSHRTGSPIPRRTFLPESLFPRRRSFSESLVQYRCIARRRKLQHITLFLEAHQNLFGVESGHL